MRTLIAFIIGLVVGAPTGMILTALLVGHRDEDE